MLVKEVYRRVEAGAVQGDVVAVLVTGRTKQFPGDGTLLDEEKEVHLHL
jgi:hypothetical protein